MSTEIAVRPKAAALPAITGTLDVMTLGKVLASTGFFPDVRDQAQAVAKILAGQELGFGPIASLTGIYMQNGKFSYMANLIAAAIKKSGRYNFRVKTLTENECAIVFFEGTEECGVSTFTRKDAERAELMTGRNAHSWKHYPKNMLFARAISNGARFYCPDVFGGVSIYTPEELGATVSEEGDVTVDAETGEIADEPKPSTPPERTPEEKAERSALRTELAAHLQSLGLKGPAAAKWMAHHYGVGNTSRLTTEQLREAVTQAVAELDVESEAGAQEVPE